MTKLIRAPPSDEFLLAEARRPRRLAASPLTRNLGQEGRRQLADCLAEVALLHEAVWPDPPNQFLFLDDVPAALNEREQYVERLLSQGHDLAVAQQDALRRIYAKATELVSIVGDVNHLAPFENYLKTI